ncbi:MAG: hypothetical protein IJK41_04805 [Muribaculaceae bacterium]|nr:hypothetical protein [Muribaculaceae bacterium]
MKPEDHIDENYVPSEEDFAPEHVDEKKQLRLNIKKGCRFNTILYSLCAVFFTINGIVKFDDISESKLYLCPLIALMFVAALIMLYYAVIYDRIRKASTGHEMQHFMNLLGSDTIFSKLAITTMALCMMAATALGLIDKCPWYVVVLAAVAVGAIIGGLWWLLKYSGKGDPRDIDIEKLQALEEEESETD